MNLNIFYFKIFVVEHTTHYEQKNFKFGFPLKVHKIIKIISLIFNYIH